MGKSNDNAMQPVDMTKSRARVSNMHTPVDTRIDTLYIIIYTSFGYDDTLLNIARHIICP